jgi:hypothetical protein
MINRQNQSSLSTCDAIANYKTCTYMVTCWKPCFNVNWISERLCFEITKFIKDRQASTDAHGGTHIATTGGTKRSRSYDDGEDNTDSTPSKQVKSVDDEIESVDEFDTLVCGVEKAGSGNGTQSADVITDDVL